MKEGVRILCVAAAAAFALIALWNEGDLLAFHYSVDYLSMWVIALEFQYELDDAAQTIEHACLFELVNAKKGIFDWFHEFVLLLFRSVNIRVRHCHHAELLRELAPANGRSMSEIHA